MNTRVPEADLPVDPVHDTTTQGSLPASNGVATSSVGLDGSSPARKLASRLLYWVPVFAALVLFAQVAFLGLRPAMREASRLAAASDMLHARWSHDQSLYDAYETQLAARRDPIFRERQSRLRRGARPRAEATSVVGAETEAISPAPDAVVVDPSTTAAGTSGF